MRSNVKLVIFDLDGTLLDTSGGILSSVEYVIKQNFLKELNTEELLSFIGPPVQESFKKHYMLSDEKAQEYAQQFRDRYKDYDLLIAKPYNGIYAMMDSLKDNDIKIAVATYKREDYALTLLKHYDFDKYAESMHGADNFNQLRKKDIIVNCMKEMKILDKDQVVYVGDTNSDKKAAEELEIGFVGVNYGFGFKDVDSYANDPLEIIRILEEEK